MDHDLLPDAIDLLRDMEWCGLHTDDEDSWAVMTRACPACSNAMKDGHKGACRLRNILDRYDMETRKVTGAT